MRWLSVLAARLRSLFRRDRLEREMDAELRFHLDRETELHLARGLSPADARRAARLAFGHVDQVKEEARDARSGAVFAQMSRDLVYAGRLLRNAPAFTVTAVVIIALGVAATTAVFSVLYGILLRPLAYREPHRLVGLWTHLPLANPSRVGVNGADYRDWRASNRVFEDIALVRPVANFNLIDVGEPERLFAARISANLLPILGVAPAIGRNFTEDEDEIGRDNVVLLSDGLWKRRFGGDPSVVGRDISLSGVPHTVVGVMSPAFVYPGREYQLWTPLTVNPREMARQEPGYSLRAIARLKPDISLEHARHDMQTVAEHLEATYPATNSNVRVEVIPLMQEAADSIRPALSIVFASALCMLLISCLNLANLLAARSAHRSREYEMRLALGASRGHLLRQALAEVVPLLLIGGLLGVVGAAWAIAAFVSLAPGGLPRIESIELDAPVLVFAVAALSACGLIAALWPAARAWRSHVVTVTQLGRSMTGGLSESRSRSALVIAQIALTLPLLVSAGLLARSFSTIVQVDPGFRPHNVLSLQMAIPRSKYRSDPDIAAFCTAILHRVAQIPGVTAAGMVNRLPLSGTVQTLIFEFESANTSPVVLGVDSRTVTPDYFRAIGIPVIDGRVFTERDTQTAKTPLISGPNVDFPVSGVIDEKIARAIWPRERAVGKRFRLPFPGAPWIEIVGVVGHIRHDGLDVDPRSQVYFNYLQRPQDRMALLIHAADGVRPLTSAIIQAIRDVDPQQPVYDVKTMDDVVRQSTMHRWLSMTLVAIFAVIALVLAGVGLYGVISYSVTRQQREFGIQLALGASRSHVTRTVLRRGTRVMIVGAAIGLALTVPTTKAMGGLLFGIQPMDAASVFAATALLVAIALLATYLPARRAAALDPTAILRSE